MSAFRRKVCRECGAEKSLRQFYRRPDTSDGYRAECKDCRRAYAREHHALKREQRLPRMLAYNAQPQAVAARAAWERSDRGRAYRRESRRMDRRMRRMEAA